MKPNLSERKSGENTRIEYGKTEFKTTATV
jgi:hypothetical protein